MEKLTISVFDWKPGMKLAQTIHNEFGAVIVIEGTVLNEKEIDKIKNLGINEIVVYEEEEEKEKSSLSNYEKNIQGIKKLMGQATVGNTLNKADIDKIVDRIISEKYFMSDLLSKTNKPEDYVFTHSVNVAILARSIGKWMNASPETLLHLTQAGLLHDIGKTQITNDIVDKPDELTDKEYHAIKQHPKHAYQILKKVKDIHPDVMAGVLCHHEREDGSGYPMGFTSERINLIAKVLAVADIFDAMTSERIYREKKSPFEVFELMQNGSFGKLHPAILTGFIKNMSSLYIGSKVRLTNNDQGEVIFINSSHIARPIVKVEDEFLDLSSKPDVKILEVIKNIEEEIA